MRGNPASIQIDRLMDSRAENREEAKENRGDLRAKIKTEIWRANRKAQ